LTQVNQGFPLARSAAIAAFVCSVMTVEESSKA
jgi:hypothetical protein